MGKYTSIEWAHHSWNPWWGCAKVSPACASCYAERDAVRYGHRVWGTAAPRRFFSEKHWMEPHRWDVEAKAAGVRRRVFCASMADVFEFRRELDGWREKLWDLVMSTSGLDWLLLTKRPENILEMIPRSWRKDPPPNVWYGATVEDQERARERIPELLKVPAKVHFLSCEPLLGPITLEDAIPCGLHCDERVGHVDHGPNGRLGCIDWIIAGGESGPAARPTHPDWIRGLRDAAQAAGVPFFFKQWGEWAPVCEEYDDRKTELLDETYARTLSIEPSGAIPVREGADGVHVDYQPAPGSWVMERIGKKAAGRLLDERTWDEVPR